MLEKFMLEDDMKCCFNSIVNTNVTSFSYESKINGDRSLLDHFLVSVNTFYAITEYTSLHHGQNLQTLMLLGLLLILMLFMLFSVILTQCALKVVTGPRPLRTS